MLFSLLRTPGGAVFHARTEGNLVSDQLVLPKDTDRPAHGLLGTAATSTSPLSALIDRHRGGRSCSQLADASDGVISRAQWEGLEQLPLWRVQPADPTVIAVIARVLGLSVGTVMHYALASRRPAA
jgi:hypothetical protein